MNILRWRGKLSGIVLMAGLMAMVLSCGGAAESPAGFGSDGSDAEALTAYATAAPARAMADSAESAGADQAMAEVEKAVVAQAAAAPTAAPAPASATAFDDANARGNAQQTEEQQAGRSIIVEAHLSLEVGRIDPAVRQVANIAVERGGWVESTQIFGEGGYRSATVGIRIPADRRDETMDALRALGRTLDESISSTDVTDRLIDNDARLNAWRTQEERLVTLLENAASVADIVEVEKRIAEVRADIERVEATQRNLTNRVATSLITVNLQLPGRFAADPPDGRLSLAAADPDGIADAVAARVAGRNGYVGQRSEYLEGANRVIELAVYVQSSDLAGLLDYAAALGDVADRQFNQVGTPPDGDNPNARLKITITANVEVSASLQLEAADPVAAAAAIRAQAETAGGFTRSYLETMDDDRRRVSMELAVKPAELRGLLDYAATLGEPDFAELNLAGQQPNDDTPSASLMVSVSPAREFHWGLFAALMVGSVAVSIGIAALIVWFVAARGRAYARQRDREDAARAAARAAGISDADAG